jgi:hypothetical protein
LPAGARITVEVNGKRREITDQQINDPDARAALKNGKIREIHLDLPADLRQEQPANRQKIDNMVAWLTKYGDKIDKTLATLSDVQRNPDAVIMYGDVEIRNGMGRFDNHGRFLGLVNPDRYQAKPGEELRPLNLVGYNFDIQKTGEGDAARYRVSQTITPENAPIWAYQNIRALGVEQVGKPMPVETKEYGPEDFVPVRNGDKIELVKAKNLETFKRMQQVEYYGQKALIATMDAAMLVSGTIEVGAAVKGARIAATAAEAGVRLTTREATFEIAKGLARMGVAGTGVFNNAGARDTEWGRAINTARDIYFVSDMAVGLGRGGLGAARRAFGGAEAAEALTAGEKVHSIINGSSKIIVNGEPLQGIPYIKQVHQGTHWAFKATEVAFVPIAAGDILHAADRIGNAGKRNPLKDVFIQVGDGRMGVLAQQGAFDTTNKPALEGARRILDGYSATLTEGRDKTVQDEVRQILLRASALMAPDASAEQKQEFRKELLSKLTFSPEQIRQLEQSHPRSSDSAEFRLSDADLHNLLDAEKRKDFPKPVRELAERFLSEKNNDVIAAARIAMLYTGRDKDGNIEDELARAQFDIPAYKRTITHYDAEGGSYTEEVDIAARSVMINATAANTVRDLKRDLACPQLGNRGIATGDCLVRLGAITHQEYAGLLQDVLLNPQASKADKMRALTDAGSARLATIIDAIRYQESDERQSAAQRDILKGRTFGLSSSELMQTLREVAKQDKDGDVRAMCAAMLYCLDEKDVKVRGRFMNAFNETWQKLGATDGAFASRVRGFLEKEMSVGVPDDAAAADKVRAGRVHAALAFAAMTADGDAAAQRQISESLAGSISPTSAAITTEVLRALMPDRIATLDAANKELATAVRQAAVELVHKPADDDAAENLVKVLQQMEPLLRGGDRSTKQNLELRLLSLLTNTAGNKDYAAGYPEVRVAAIDLLAAMGSRNSLEVIRTHIADGAPITIGKEEIAARESNAAVRAAAVRALEKMKDPLLRQMVSELVGRETDANTAALLRDVRFAGERIDPTSEVYKRIFEKTRVDVIGPFEKQPHLAGFGDRQRIEFLNANFPLLNAETFRNRMNEEAKNAMGWWDRKFSLTATERLEETKKVCALQNERNEQWTALCKMAKGRDENADKAKLALLYIIQSHGGILGTQSGFSIQMDGDKLHQRVYNHDWKDMAARALSECAEVGCTNRDITAACIKQAITNPSLPPHTCDWLLTGWQKLGQRSPDGFAVPREQQTEVLVAALTAEFGRVPGEQQSWYQGAILAEIQRLGARRTIPVLEAIAKDSRLPSVAKQAAEIMDTWQHSVQMVWDDTTVWQAATPEQRANRLKQALADGNDSEQTVQEMFAAYKGYKIANAADPAMPFLQMALNDSNERTRLAAAKILAQSSLASSDSVRRKAQEVLHAMAKDSKVARYRQEAIAELKALQ